MIDQDARIAQTFHANRSTHTRAIGERRWLAACRAPTADWKVCCEVAVRLAARSTWEAAVEPFRRRHQDAASARQKVAIRSAVP
jgi:hypothetical protein